MIDQIGIGIFGVTGIVMANMRQHGARKWAPILGMAGQGFWFWMAIDKKLWGVLFMSLVYTAAWGLGIYNHWFAKNTSKVGI